MTTILQLIHGNTVKLVGVIWNDLEASLEGGWLTVEITTSNQKDLVFSVLAVGEIVSEVMWDVDFSFENLL